MFYDDSILSGTKTTVRCVYFNRGFMMTQFFQVLKQAFQRLPIFFCFMMTQFFQVLKPLLKLKKLSISQFYDDSILSGTKTIHDNSRTVARFYDDSILSGTKTNCRILCHNYSFYDDSILSGTKTI